ncbi:hypothetical protein JTE90_029608 [Oedothorax gibbosus]|uniref:Uncharacterized protein n=1 Tax=Oedothorax gibbosus TaxID=931172 RepID=A0AAV6UUT8_9ARAC|nr:hypothetical protein JTE90_029608 [Oedothorax gibbosus]
MRKSSRAPTEPWSIRQSSHGYFPVITDCGRAESDGGNTVIRRGNTMTSKWGAQSETFDHHTRGRALKIFAFQNLIHQNLIPEDLITEKQVENFQPKTFPKKQRPLSIKEQYQSLNQSTYCLNIKFYFLKHF